MEDPVETSNGSSNSVSNRDSALEPVGGPIKTPNRAELGVPIGPQSGPQLGSRIRVKRFSPRREALNADSLAELNDFAGPIGGPNSALQFL